MSNCGAFPPLVDLAHSIKSRLDQDGLFGESLSIPRRIHLSRLVFCRSAGPPGWIWRVCLADLPVQCVFGIQPVGRPRKMRAQCEGTMLSFQSSPIRLNGIRICSGFSFNGWKNLQNITRESGPGRFARSPAFRRFRPAKAGTPCRIIENLPRKQNPTGLVSMHQVHL